MKKMWKRTKDVFFEKSANLCLISFIAHKEGIKSKCCYLFNAKAMAVFSFRQFVKVLLEWLEVENTINCSLPPSTISKKQTTPNTYISRKHPITSSREIFGFLAILCHNLCFSHCVKDILFLFRWLSTLKICKCRVIDLTRSVLGGPFIHKPNGISILLLVQLLHVE